MGLLGASQSQVDYLEEERQKLWDRLGVLEEGLIQMRQDINHSTSDDVKEAKENSKRTSEYRNRAHGRLDEINQLVDQFTSELEAARATKNEINELRNTSSEIKNNIDEAKSRLDDSESEYQQKLNTLNSKIATISETLEKYPDLDEQLTEIDDFITTVESNSEKSGLTLSNINKRKKEIDDLHREIFGYVAEDQETGAETKIEGLKDELEASYRELDEKLEQSFKDVDGLNSNYEKKYDSFEKKYKEKYKEINDTIAKLMPDALTAGLSSAFSKKKEEEVESSIKLQSRFQKGINLMIGISLLPVIISIYFLATNISLEEVINRLPRLVLAIIPMYAPVLWFTYSANRKMNLSKRLIEEYAHKEVLSRTYEGLSTQIENISDSEQSEELKYRLLANFLQVSSENPGKLISNYEASDHPVMEALEQSYKFQLAMDKLEGIPGINKIAAKIEKNAKKKVAAKEEIINKAFSANDELDTQEPTDA